MKKEDSTSQDTSKPGSFSQGVTPHESLMKGLKGGDKGSSKPATKK